MEFLIKYLFLITFVTFTSIGSFAQIEKKDTLKITSWNIHLLPAPAFFRSRKKKRTKLIIAHFNKQQENDVLLFQEVFHKKRRKQLIKGLTNVYPYHTQVVNSAKGKLLKTNSGLITFSKLPFKEVNRIQFNDCSGTDCMAFKGAQMTSFVINGQLIYIINTHLNSEPPRSIALEQMKMIEDSLISIAFENSTNIFVGGDFNINKSDSENYQEMINVFKTKNDCHFDKIISDKGERIVEKTLDYIFLYNAIESDLKIKKYKFLIGPEWIKGKSKKVYNKTVGYSDHYPVQSVIEILKP